MVQAGRILNIAFEERNCNETYYSSFGDASLVEPALNILKIHRLYHT